MKVNARFVEICWRLNEIIFNLQRHPHQWIFQLFGRCDASFVTVSSAGEVHVQEETNIIGIMYRSHVLGVMFWVLYQCQFIPCVLIKWWHSLLCWCGIYWMIFDDEGSELDQQSYRNCSFAWWAPCGPELERNGCVHANDFWTCCRKMAFYFKKKNLRGVIPYQWYHTLAWRWYDHGITFQPCQA